MYVCWIHHEVENNPRRRNRKRKKKKEPKDPTPFCYVLFHLSFLFFLTFWDRIIYIYSVYCVHHTHIHSQKNWGEGNRRRRVGRDGWMDMRVEKSSYTPPPHRRTHLNFWVDGGEVQSWMRLGYTQEKSYWSCGKPQGFFFDFSWGALVGAGSASIKSGESQKDTLNIFVSSIFLIFFS